MLSDYQLIKWFRLPENVPKMVYLPFSTTGGVAQIDHIYTVPKDYDLHAQTIILWAQGDLGQTITLLQIYAYAEIASSTQIARLEKTTPTTREQLMIHQPYIIIPSGHTIRGTAAFSAGAGNNRADFGITGFLIPRLEILLG